MPGSPFWMAVKKVREALPPSLFVASTGTGYSGSAPGVVSEVSPSTAAEHLVSGALRIATAEEIQRHLAELERQRVLAGSRSDAATGKFRFSETEAAVRAASAAMAPTKGKH